MGHWPRRALRCPPQRGFPGTGKGRDEKAIRAAEFGAESNTMSKEGKQEIHPENWVWDRSPGAPSIGHLVCE